MTLAHWDELEPRRPQRPGLGGAWTQLGTPAGSKTVGLNRIQLDPGEVSTPAHVHGADEEIFFVLAGSGLSWQDGETYEVRAGDCLVHAPLGKAHTLRGGDDGLDVLAYGQRTPHRRRLPAQGRHLLALARRGPRSARARTRSSASRTSSGRSPRRGPARSSTSTTSRATYGGALEAARPGRRRDAERPQLGRAAAGRGGRAAALPLGRGGAVRHPRRRGDARAVAARRSPACRTRPSRRRRTRCAAATSSRGPPGTRISHCLRAGRPGSRISPTARESRTTSATTRARTRSSSAALGLIARLEPLEYSDGEPS